ncbi:hypothetical protein D7X88_11520 [bacterium C-53]|nr:hypothetical protein [Lachnospiraceae bacterium]RKJ09423.1 hypothetical protein D7X88_11520 [bacterium C-53]
MLKLLGATDSILPYAATYARLCIVSCRASQHASPCLFNMANPQETSVFSKGTVSPLFILKLL